MILSFGLFVHMFMLRTPLVLDERVALRRSFGTEAERAAAALRPARRTNSRFLDLAVARGVQARQVHRILGKQPNPRGEELPDGLRSFDVTLAEEFCAGRSAVPSPECI